MTRGLRLDGAGAERDRHADGVGLMTGPIAFVRGLRRPEAFHGAKVTSGFFEGWYVKLVSADLAPALGRHPGHLPRPRHRRRRRRGTRRSSRCSTGRRGAPGTTCFPVSAFVASSRAVRRDGGGQPLHPDGRDPRPAAAEGRIDFTTPLQPWPVTWRSPGIMGWYGLVPVHGVLPRHRLLRPRPARRRGRRGRAGVLRRRARLPREGLGRAFPAGYVWMHSNHIDADPTASLVASVALIPWVRSTFRGFIVGLRPPRAPAPLGDLQPVPRRRCSPSTTSTSGGRSTGPDGRLELSGRAGAGRPAARSPAARPCTSGWRRPWTAGSRSGTWIPAGGSSSRARASCAGMEVFGDIDRLLATEGR